MSGGLNAGSIFGELILKGDQFFTTLDQAQSKSDGFAGKFENVGNRIANTGKNMTLKVTTPIVGIGTAAALVGIKFESAMSNVQAVSGATAEEMAQLEGAAREAGATTSKSATDAADALGYMALAGWDVNRAMDSLLPVLHLSEAGNIDLARASSLVTDTMAAMGLEADELDYYLDVLAQTARNSNTDIDQMAEAYLGVGGTLRGLNIPLDESAVALGMMANAGIKGSEAGNSLNKVLLNLTNPVGAAETAISDLGLEVFDNQGNFKGLTTVLMDLKDKTKDMTEEQQNYYLSSIAGSPHVKTMSALMNGLDDSYEDLAGAIANADGALGDMRDTMVDNQKGSIDNLKSALEELGLKVYDVLKPAIAEATKFIQGLVDKLNSLTPAQQENIVKLAALAAGIGPVLLVGGKLIAGIGTVTKLFGLFSGATAAAGAASATAAGAAGVGGLATGMGGLGLAAKAGALLLNPVTAIIAGVGLAAVVTAKHLSEDAIPAVELFGDGVSQATADAVGGFLDLEEQATLAINQLAWSGQEVTAEMAEGIVANITTMKEQIIGQYTEQKEEALGTLTDLFATSKDMTEEEKEEMLRITSEKFDGQIKSTEDGAKKIEEILKKAKEENRAISQSEADEIVKIKEKMKEDGVRTLSETEAESMAILESLKQQSGEVTAKMAAETVKNSLEQKNKAVENAEAEYKERLKAAAQLKADGTKESIALADKVIKEAKKQRDESVKAAEDMHEKVVTEAKDQAKEYVKEVDWTSGEVKTKWGVIKTSISESLSEAGKSIGEGIQKIRDWNDQTVKEKVFSIVEKVKSIFSSEGSRPKNNARGTSYFDGGWTWVGEQGRELVNLPKGSQIASNPKSEKAAGSGGSSNVVNNWNVAATIREDADIKKVAKELNEYQKKDSRGRGVVTI